MASPYLYVPEINLSIAVINFSSGGDDRVFQFVQDSITARRVERFDRYGDDGQPLILNWGAVAAVKAHAGEHPESRYVAEATFQDDGFVSLFYSERESR